MNLTMGFGYKPPLIRRLGVLRSLFLLLGIIADTTNYTYMRYYIKVSHYIQYR